MKDEKFALDGGPPAGFQTDGPRPGNEFRRVAASTWGSAMSQAGNRRANSPKKVPLRADWLSQAIGKMGAITRILTEGTPRQPWQRRPLLIEQFEPRETPAALITGFSDDTGTLGDRITSDRTITLTGTANANALVRVLNGTTAIGSVSASAQGTWSFTTASLADGSHDFTATDADTTEYLTGTPYTLSPDGSNPYVISQDLGQNWTFEAEYKMNSSLQNDLNGIFSYGMFTEGVLLRTLRSDALYLNGTNLATPTCLAAPTLAAILFPSRSPTRTMGPTARSRCLRAEC